MPEISQFYISDDRRKDRGALADLAESIRAVGLLQPILVEATEKGFDVLGGRRRFTAMTEILGFTELEEHKHFRIVEGLDKLVVQLTENSHRKDFTPMEEASLVYDIHHLSVKQQGAAVAGPGKSGWSMEDTAKFIGRDKGYVSRMLTLMDNSNITSQCSSVNEALTLIKKEKEKVIQDKIRHARAEKAVIAPDIAGYTDNVFQDNALDFTRSLPDESVDMILTDPPFAINYGELIDAEYDAAYDDDPQQVEDLLVALMPEYYRVLKPNKYVVIWTGYIVEHIVRDALKKAGFMVWNPPLVWIKLNTGGKSLQPDIRPGNVVQHAMLAWKGIPEITTKGRHNAFAYPVVKENRIHRAQMPEELVADLISLFSFEGDVVLDTFAGSLSVMRGCFMTKRRYLACEKEENNIMDGIAYTQEWVKGRAE